MLSNLDRDGIFLKILFDGYDFIQSEIGSILVPDRFRESIFEKTFVAELYPEINEFIEYCQENYRKNDLKSYIPKHLMNKYRVGIYQITDCYDYNNPCKDKKFILFNSQEINNCSKKFDLNSIKFWVCPSFDAKDNCNGIGFRIVNSKSVKNAFKWIFMQGNNIIYGKDSVDINKDCYIVEGFRDYIALKELGYNVIGLGSVIISKLQERYINQLKSPILLLDNDNFGLKKSIQYKDKYRIATLINSKQKDAYDAWIKEGKINISEII